MYIVRNGTLRITNKLATLKSSKISKTRVNSYTPLYRGGLKGDLMILSKLFETNLQ